MDVEGRVEHRYVENEGVKLHYAALGEGPLIVMLHGFPDYWYTWRHQMAALCGSYRIAVPDLRGYNLSDKPKGIENYGMRALLGDVRAVIREEGREEAITAGHDWGGYRLAVRYAPAPDDREVDDPQPPASLRSHP